MVSEMNFANRLFQAASAIYTNVYRGKRSFGYHISVIKFCIRGLCFFSETEAWFDTLSHDRFKPLTTAHPRIYGKLQRPYLTTRCDKKSQLAILKQHYQFMEQQFDNTALVDIFLTPGGMTLAKFDVKDAGEFALRLMYNGRYEKEGELTIVLRKEDSREAIFNLTFCISSNQPDRRELFIGGIQGSKASRDKDLIIGITRGMHGLRPKALLLWAAQQLSQNWNVQSLQAVSDSICVSQLYAKTKELHSSYDSFWNESGGSINPDKSFTIPTSDPHRDLAEMKPSKRQMYRRRYAMLDLMAVQIRASLDSNLPKNHAT